MKQSAQREFDVVVWGATGFTGRLVAEYLYNQYGLNGNLKWAIAGRNKGKLLSIRSMVASEDVPVIVADSASRSTLDDMVKRTKVICTTVGPYAKYGSDLVASCVENRTDYCDLTGEVQWMRRMIDLHHETAAAHGVRIVHTCGFDSIPSDMGVFFLQNHIYEKTGTYATHIKGRVKASKGGVSGGTLASLDNVMVEAQKDPDVQKTLSNPYGLNPRNDMEGPDGPDLTRLIYDKSLKSWTCPFIMAVINTKVVRRSQALMGRSYGKDFRYDEAMLTGRGLAGRLKGLGWMAALGALSAGKPGSLLKKMMNKALPDPGEGPSKAEREAGFFNLLFVGSTKDSTTFKASVKGDRDPGYGSTCKMLGESAVCLAKDKSADSPKGVLTPSVAMGNALLERLENNAGLTFSIRE